MSPPSVLFLAYFISPWPWTLTFWPQNLKLLSVSRIAQCRVSLVKVCLTLVKISQCYCSWRTHACKGHKQNASVRPQCEGQTHKKNVVATFSPRSSHISNARFTHSLLLASSLAAGRRSAPRDRAMAGLLLFVDSLLNRCYLLISGSVMVRVRARVSAMVTVRDRAIIGFRRNHSWSSTFTPRRNHSLCLKRKLIHQRVETLSQYLRTPIQPF